MNSFFTPVESPNNVTLPDDKVIASERVTEYLEVLRQAVLMHKECGMHKEAQKLMLDNQKLIAQLNPPGFALLRTELPDF
jgi:hypothetical protein